MPISEAVLRRRQLDLNRRTADLNEYFDLQTFDAIKKLPAHWRQLDRDVTLKIASLYKKMGAMQDPTKLKTLQGKMDRLEAYATQIRADIDRATYGFEAWTTGQLKQNFEKSYYMNGWAMEQAARVTASIPVLSPAQVLGVLCNPWLPDGNNYSRRIRANADLLAKEMKTIIEDAVKMGTGWNEVARNISKSTGDNYFRAVTLARTEMTRAQAMGASYSYIQNNDILDGKRWNATKDKYTSAKDAANDGEVFDLEYDTPENPGVPGKRIPNHPNCRCIWSPTLSALGINDRERVAKDVDGKRIYTQAGTYREYAKLRSLPDLDERLANDNLKSYLRPGESLADMQKSVKRFTLGTNTINVPAPSWESPAAATPIAKLPTQPLETTPRFATVEEAEAYASKFAEDVVFKRYNLDTATTINETLDHLFYTYDIPKFTKLHSATKQGAAGTFTGSMDTTINVKRGNLAISAIHNMDKVRNSMLEDFKIGKYALKKANLEPLDAIRQTVTHEFGHALYDSKLSSEELRKAVTKIKSRYSREVNTYRKKYRIQNLQQALLSKDMDPDDLEKFKSIFISDYADTNIDEWVAEAFTDAFLSETPSPYSLEVLEVINKNIPLKGVVKIVTTPKKVLAKVIQDIVDATKNYAMKELNDNQRRTFAKELLATFGLDKKAVVGIKALKGANGSCVYYTHTGKIDLTEFNLLSTDNREKEYKIKTALHELFHASNDGLVHDFEVSSRQYGVEAYHWTFKDWTDLEETFTESAAHYLAREAGIVDLQPSYSEKLVRNLPQLKQINMFKKCKTVEDFGEIMVQYRMVDKKPAYWKDIFHEVEKTNVDAGRIIFKPATYAKDNGYSKYVLDNLDELVDKFLENTPVNKPYKQRFIDQAREIWESVEDHAGIPLVANNTMLFNELMIAAMKKMGVK